MLTDFNSPNVSQTHGCWPFLPSNFSSRSRHHRISKTFPEPFSFGFHSRPPDFCIPNHSIPPQFPTSPHRPSQACVDCPVPDGRPVFARPCLATATIRDLNSSPTSQCLGSTSAQPRKIPVRSALVQWRYIRHLIIVSILVADQFFVESDVNERQQFHVRRSALLSSLKIIRPFTTRLLSFPTSSR